MATLRRPKSSTNRTVSWIVPGRSSRRVTVLAVTTMSAPSRASSAAMALPMPRLLPVTNAVLPLNGSDCPLMRHLQCGSRTILPWGG